VVLAAHAVHNSTCSASSRVDPWSLGTKVRWGVTELDAKDRSIQFPA
jgi:hypothetical protein